MKKQDFVMQIYYGTILEMLTLNLPVLACQITNNIMLDRWTTRTIIAASIIGFNSLLTFEKMIRTMESMGTINAEMMRIQLLKDAQKRDRDRKIRSSQDVEEIEKLKLEQALAKEVDAWRTTIFSTQFVFKNTKKLAACSLLAIAIVTGILFLPFWQESCGSGYYALRNTLGINDPKAFSVIQDNLCGNC